MGVWRWVVSYLLDNGGGLEVRYLNKTRAELAEWVTDLLSNHTVVYLAIMEDGYCGEA